MSDQTIGATRWMRTASWIHQVCRVYSGVVTAGIVAASGLIVVMVGLVLYATVMRYLFDKPQMWSEQLNGILLVTAALLALAHCLRKDIHVRVELVVSHFRVRPKGIADTVAALAGLSFAGLLIWKGWNLAWVSYVHGYIGVSPPGYPLFASQVMVPIGFFILAMAFLEKAAKAISKVRRGRD